MPKPSLIALIVIGLGSVSLCDAQEVGFIRIFDGKTLNGWSAPDMSYWSVEEGAITGRATREHPNPKSRWLVWQGGEVGDFELKLKFRIYGTVEANSGVQFRTVFSSENTHASGYQADLVRDPVWMGLIYDEGTGRKVLTHRGDRTVIDEAGGRATKKFADSAKLFKLVKLDGWNEYRVIARGNDLRAIINGHLMSEVIDRDKKYFRATGFIGLQLHSGPPMEVQFKDILLKKYLSARPPVSAARTWTLEDPQERASLPEFQKEAAAKISELTPANGYPRRKAYLQCGRIGFLTYSVET